MHGDEGVLDYFLGGLRVPDQHGGQADQGPVVLGIQLGDRAVRVPLRARRVVLLSGSGVLMQPGPVPFQALVEVVLGAEPGLLQLGDLLVDARKQHVLGRATWLAAGHSHGAAPSGSSPSNGWSVPTCRSSLRRTRYRCTLTVFSSMPRTWAISLSFMSSCQRSRATACCRCGRPWMIRQHRSSAIDDSACSGGLLGRGLLRGVGLDLLVQGLDPRQTVAEGRLPAEAVHRDAGQHSPQPATALLLGQVPQNMPGLGRGLEGGLDQILGHRPVPAGQHARIPEQVTGIGPEAGR